MSNNDLIQRYLDQQCEWLHLNGDMVEANSSVSIEAVSQEFGRRLAARGEKRVLWEDYIAAKNSDQP